MSKKIRDTAAEAQRDPLLTMLSLPVFGGSSGAIEAQEARGQRELAQSNQLPRIGLLVGYTNYGEPPEGTPELLPAWKAIGVSLVALGSDKLFADVALPKGWKIKPTSHSMWSDLVDAKGRKRAGIFYKAAFYDRGAHMSLNRRYGVGGDYGKDDTYAATVTDGGTKAIFTTKAVPGRDYEATEAVRREAAAWLAENYPRADDVLAYWDEP